MRPVSGRVARVASSTETDGVATKYIPQAGNSIGTDNAYIGGKVVKTGKDL